MSKIFKSLTRTTVFKIISVAWIAYFVVALFGVSGSYLTAINGLALFFSIWALGFNCRGES